uniref:Uncharacterized protein n=1 Tax=Rhizophora mucronata TaxID=61149 RepID=A0A2P2P7H1_RHIMU
MVFLLDSSHHAQGTRILYRTTYQVYPNLTRGNCK